MPAWLLAVVVLLAAAPAWARPMVAVTACGQSVPKGALGYLTADLDCTGYAGGPGAVVLGTNATLDLRGFTLTTDTIFGVFCNGLTEQDGALHACSVTAGTITGATGQGITGRRVKVSHVTITDSSYGITATGPVIADDLTVSGTNIGVLGSKSVKITSSTITGNTETGVRAGKKLRVADSTVVDNGEPPACDAPYRDCGDLVSPKRPTVIDSTCERSAGKPFSQNGFDWEVCSLD